MTKSNIKMRIIFFVAIVLVASCAAEAANVLGTVTVSFVGDGAGRDLTFFGGNNSWSTHFGILELNKTADTGQGNWWRNGMLGVFCIQLTQYTTASSQIYNVVMPRDAQDPNTSPDAVLGTVRETYLNELRWKHFDPNWVYPSITGPFTAAQMDGAAAFQAAVWEIAYENVPTSPTLYDVNTNGSTSPRGFYCSGNTTVQALANSWLRSLTGSAPPTDLHTRTFVNGTYQDYLIPEPATIALLGLSALSLLRRKRV